MTHYQTNVAVFSLALLAFSLPAVLYLQQNAWDEESLGATLRLGARLSLLIYLLIFVARPMRTLAANTFSQLMVKNRRSLGIAFAAIMTAHLYLLIILNGLPAAYLGMLVYVFIYLMLVTSFNKPAALLGPKRWMILHKTGLYVIGIALAQAQFTRIASGVAEPVHYVLAGLVLLAIGIRITAWYKQRS